MSWRLGTTASAVILATAAVLQFSQGALFNSKPLVPNSRPTWEPEDAPGIKTVNFASHDLPKIVANARWVDLFNGIEFDDIQKDTPDELRPPAIIVFHGYKTCPKAIADIKFDHASDNVLPSRERLAIYRYDMDAAPVRAWYKFTPEMDLTKRFGVTECPTIVFVPRKCSGWTEWCTKKPTDPILGDVVVAGCADFKEQCTGFKLFAPTKETQNWVDWVKNEIKLEGEPQISPFLRTYAEQGMWLRRRQATTEMNHIRNVYLAEAFPAFTQTGYKPMQTPKPVQDWFIDFWKRRRANRKIEAWHGDATQLSFHEVPATFIDTDMERADKERIANEYIKPILEAWSGVAPLELTSFYGLREYHEGSFLMPHLDRIDTHVLSVTFSIAKLDPKTLEIIEDTSDLEPWPLEVCTFHNGEMVRYQHKAGTMVLYESSKLIHGRPYPNPKGGAIHLSAFVHFKPLHMHGKEATAWEGIAKRARMNMNTFVQNAQWKSPASVEPEHPVYSKKSYGENTIWTHLGGNGEAEEDDERPDSQIQVALQNLSDRPLDVYWNGEESGLGLVLQSRLAPGTKYQIGTYPFHQFFWAEVGAKVPVAGGSFTIDSGKRLYVYSIPKAVAEVK